MVHHFALSNVQRTGVHSAWKNTLCRMKVRWELAGPQEFETASPMALVCPPSFLSFDYLISLSRNKGLLLAHPFAAMWYKSTSGRMEDQRVASIT